MSTCIVKKVFLYITPLGVSAWVCYFGIYLKGVTMGCWVTSSVKECSAKCLSFIFNKGSVHSIYACMKTCTIHLFVFHHLINYENVKECALHMCMCKNTCTIHLFVFHQLQKCKRMRTACIYACQSTCTAYL